MASKVGLESPQQALPASANSEKRASSSARHIIRAGASSGELHGPHLPVDANALTRAGAEAGVGEPQVQALHPATPVAAPVRVQACNCMPHACRWSLPTKLGGPQGSLSQRVQPFPKFGPQAVSAPILILVLVLSVVSSEVLHTSCFFFLGLEGLLFNLSAKRSLGSLIVGVRTTPVLGFYLPLILPLHPLRIRPPTAFAAVTGPESAAVIDRSSPRQRRLFLPPPTSTPYLGRKRFPLYHSPAFQHAHPWACCLTQSRWLHIPRPDRRSTAKHHPPWALRSVDGQYGASMTSHCVFSKSKSPRHSRYLRTMAANLAARILGTSNFSFL